MKVLINSKIIIKEAVKNKSMGFYIVLSKKDKEQLLVKAKNSNGRGQGIVGKITRGGHFITNEHFKLKGPEITPKVQVKIDILLDLIFGIKRDRKVEINKEGLVHFINTRKLK